MASNHSLEVAELRSKIVCQICETTARPGKTKWYRCSNMHQICQDCHGKRKCSCEEPISKIHCEWTEEFLEKVNRLKLKLNCKNAKNGCKEAFDENALEEHESECVYRLVPCMNSSLGCKEKVIFQNVIQHFEKEHATLIPMDNNSKKEAPYISNVKIDLNGKHFILKCFFTSQNSSSHCTLYDCGSSVQWVYFIGSPDEAKHFSFTLKFFGPNSTNVYTGKVTSIDEFESYETLLASGKVCTFDLQDFKQFLNEDRKYEYSLEIRNLKEEAKDENVDSGASDIEDSNE